MAGQSERQKTGDNPEILGESLPFDERVRVEAWKGKQVETEEYLAFHRETIDSFPSIWAKMASELEWFKPWDQVVSKGDYAHVYRWFPGGELNIGHLAVDRHAKSAKTNKLAMIWEGEPVDSEGHPTEVRKLTYGDLLREVNRVTCVMRNDLGLKKGDKIAVYMPLVPEAIIVMLAAARLGVTFTVVFSGFSAEALSSRMNDLGASTLFTADGFYRRGKVVPLKQVADQAASAVPSLRHIVVTRRIGTECEMVSGRDYYLDDLLTGVAKGAVVDPEPVASDHPLYVLYTSGTTGKPKGIIHDTGGYATLLHATMNWAFDIRDEDVFWCPADIGWVTGHSYVAFGPLIEGTTMVIYEGSLDFPQPDRWWSIIERYGVSVFYTTPTATRAQMKFGDGYVTGHDLSSLRVMHSVGEPINPSAWRWLYEVVGGKRCPVGSTWWMTETGGIMISHLPGLMLVPLKPGSNGLPLPGIDAQVFDETGEPVPHGKKGLLVLGKPWPGMPSPPTGMWGDPDRFEKQYYGRFPGLDAFFCGDYAVKDSDGFIWVAGRADEVLKVAGHRLGTYEIESSIVSYKAATEAAVVPVPDPLKGEVPIAFVVLKQGYSPSNELRTDIKHWVRTSFSPIAEPSRVFFVNKLPKTRSGKIMRRLIKAVAEGRPLGDVATLEDEASVEEVKEAYKDLEVS